MSDQPNPPSWFPPDSFVHSLRPPPRQPAAPGSASAAANVDTPERPGSRASEGDPNAQGALATRPKAAEAPQKSAPERVGEFVTANNVDWNGFNRWFHDAGHPQTEANVYDSRYLGHIKSYVHERDAAEQPRLPPGASGSPGQQTGRADTSAGDAVLAQPATATGQRPGSLVETGLTTSGTSALAAEPARQSPSGGPPPRTAEDGRQAPSEATAKAGAANAQAGDQKPATPQGARGGRDDARIREVLDQLVKMQPNLDNNNQRLATTIETLGHLGEDPTVRRQEWFRHQVAYAFQDLEKASIGRTVVSAHAREEMQALAGSAPGLQNERMQALMRDTASVSSEHLIRNIRAAGAEIGRQADQATPDIQGRIETLENQVRLAPRPAAPDGPTRVGNEPAASRLIEGNAKNDRQQPNQVLQPDTVPFTGGQGQASDKPNYNNIFRVLRPAGNGAGQPWDPMPTPMGERIAAHAAKMQEGADHHALGRAEKSGRAAFDALQGFNAGEGAIVMNRIREAARSDPDGMAGVLSDMREGGRYAGLRQQFNAALASDRGVSAAYDKAAAALAAYGKDRTEVEQIIARRPDAASLSARFERMDAEIGEAASSTPSRRDAKTMLDDLAKQAVEIVQRAAEKVKDMFTRAPSASTSSGPSTSP